MKLSISTLGCPDWTFEQILDTYEKLGIEGIEVRGIEGIMDADKIPQFFPENQEATLAAVKAHGLKLIGFGTSCNFHDAKPEKVAANIATAKTAVDVCARMGIPAIRVFGNDVPKDERAAAVAKQIGESIAEVCRYAKDKGVRVNLEIHGTINTVEAVTPIIDIAGKEPMFGILWDVQHSDKVYGDNWEVFYKAIRPFIRHIHLKDHFRNTEPAFKLCGIGEGDIPLKKIVNRLLTDGYDGYFSFEWERKWHPELDTPEVAFPVYKKLMDSFVAKPAKRLCGLSVSGVHFTEEFAAACKEGGVESFEISDRDGTYDQIDWNKLAELTKKYGLRLNSVHLPFSGKTNISHLDPAARAATLETDKAIMKQAAAVGVGIAVIHPSAEPIADEDRAAYMANSKASLKELADYAAELGMVVAVEDLPRTCLGRNHEEMAELLTADERLRICFDTNHLLGEPLETFVRALGDKFVTLHVSDYDFVDERHLIPGECKIDWIEFMDLLDEVGYEGVFTYETGLGKETARIIRKRAMTPADLRKNYESLVDRASHPYVVGIVKLGF